MMKYSLVIAVLSLTPIPALTETATISVTDKSGSISTQSDQIGNDSIAIYNQGKSTWHMRLIGAGLGFGSRCNIGYGQQPPGFVVFVDAGTLAWGFDGLGGAGFGFSIYECILSGHNRPDSLKKKGDWSISTNGLPDSFMPLYLYFPVLKKSHWHSDTQLKTGGVRVVSPFLYLFAGGSAWADLPGWHKPAKYVHGGLSILWFVANVEGGEIVARQYGPVSHGFQAGVFYSPGYVAESGAQVDEQVGFYICWKFAYGGNCY